MTFLANLPAPTALGLLLLFAASTAAGWAAWRRNRGRPAPGWAWPAALLLGLVAAGGLGLGGSKFTLAGFDIDVSLWLLAGPAAVFLVALVWLASSGGWSYRLGLVLAALMLLGVGGLAVAPAGRGLAEVFAAVRGLEFVRPAWLVLLVFVPLVFLVSRRSLSGLGPVRKWVAVSARASLVALLVLALAEPRFRRTSENVTVLFVVDRSFSVPPEYSSAPGADGEPLDLRWDRVRRFINDSAKFHPPGKRDDQAGVILFGKRPKLVLPPAPVGDRLPVDERMAGPIDGQYTDIAAALKLALASFPEGTSKRVVLVSDGNENLGRAEAQAELAKQQGVQIDVLPLASGYKNENEVLVQAVEAPPQTAQGARLPVRVLVRNASPTRVVEGTLELVQVKSRGDGGEVRDSIRVIPIVDGPGVLEKPPADPKALPAPAKVRLRPGLNVFRFRDRADDPLSEAESSFTYRATFLPTRSFDPDGRNVAVGLPGDRTSNNRATSAVVARGQRRVLFVDERVADKSPHQHLVDTLRRAKLRVDMLPAGELPGDRGDLGVFLSNYDCLVVANVPSETFGEARMEVIRDSVSEQGMGLVFVGGPDSYGPGGYQQTPIEAALPVECEIKAKKAMGKGGLVLIMHASEMADGNKWQKEVAKLAIDKLGPVDMVGVLYFGALASWYIPFQTVGTEKDALKAKIDRMTPGDMPDFDPFLKLAADTLADPQHGLAAKLTMVISDGDPAFGPIGTAAVGKMASTGTTCVTVGVATHGGADHTKMSNIAAPTKGRFYNVTDPSKLPSIYTREVRRVSQSFLYTEPFGPKLRIRGGLTAQLPDQLPRLHGFVRTTIKPSAISEMAIEGPTVFDQRFPVLANWQYGAGRAVAFTSDARSQPNGTAGWDKEWVGSDLYQKFWEQVVTWAMRTAETGRLNVTTEYREGRVRVIVDARDERDRPIPGVTLRGKVSAPATGGPNDKPPAVEFNRTGPGRFEAEFPAEEAGAYFVNVQAIQNGQVVDGARSGVTVPYSPEFADLETNAALLRRVAETTGGQVYDEAGDSLERAAKTSEVFRDAPKTVRALLPFWFWLVFLAGVGLLFDVGVRRISLEPAEVKAAAAGWWTYLRTRRMASEKGSDELDRLRRRKEATREELEQRRVATRRFDPTAAPPPASPIQTADDIASAPPPPPAASVPPPPPPPAGDDAFERLRAAKRRAGTQRDDPNDPNAPRR